ARWAHVPRRPPAPGAAGPGDPAARTDGGAGARAAAGPARAGGGARHRAAGAAGRPAAHPLRGPRRRARGHPAAGPPAAAVRPAQRRVRPRAGAPRRERRAARARRRRLLPGAADRLRGGAAGAAAPPGPPKGPAPERGGTGMSTLIHLPVFGLVLTLGAYLVAYWLHQRTGRPGVLSPVLVTTAIVATVLLLTGLPYEVYLGQVSLLTMRLGPATVALALPLLRNGRALAGSAPAVTAALVAGGVLSIALTVGVLQLFGVADGVLRAALPRSVTSPVGLSIAEALQASASLAVVLTMVSGVLGAAFGPALLSLARVQDDRARGFAVGLTSHGIGTSRVLADSTVAGGWSSAAMVLNALVMTVVLPIVAAVVTG